jgi:2'-5' RNA ligase
VRIFVALEIPQAVRDSLEQLCRQLAKRSPATRWTRLQGAHITLKFIGEKSVDELERIKAALREIPGRAPFEILFRGLGFFPNQRRPRVFWAGMEGNNHLAALAADVETQLAPLGIPREDREFRPHITLARIEPSDDVAALRAAVAEFAANTETNEFGRASAAEFHLHQSVLKSSGAEYTRLATFKFSPERA